MADRTLEDDLHKNVRPWPNDWDWHIIKTASFYFLDASNPSISVAQSVSHFYGKLGQMVSEEDLTYGLIRSNLMLDQIDLRMTFFVADVFIYVALFVMDRENSVLGTVFRISHRIDHENQSDEGDIVIPLTLGFAVGVPVGTARGETGHEICEQLEIVIRKDYWDNRGDDEQSDPEPEPDPVSSTPVLQA